MPTREELHRLIDSLPDEAIPAAHMALTQLQTWLPPIPPELESRMEAFGGGGGSVTFSAEPGSHMRSRESFTFTDGEDDVQESTIVHDGVEFTLIERIRRDAVTGEMSFVIELAGPDGTTARHEHRYAL
jgi:hypothetical protein